MRSGDRLLVMAIEMVSRRSVSHAYQIKEREVAEALGLSVPHAAELSKADCEQYNSA